jgi:hypothetical protein
MIRDRRSIARLASIVAVAVVASVGMAGCELLTRMTGAGGGAGQVTGTGAGTGAANTAGGSGGPSVPPPQPYDYPPADGIIVNGSFERGLEGWDVWDQRPSRSPGNNVIETADWAERKGKVLHITRTSDRDGGASGVIQKLAYDCSAAKSLWVTYKGYINFEQGANIASANPKWFPEGGAQVRLKYLDAAGVEHEWYHGLYMTPTQGADTERFTQVSDNAWTHYVSPDLMKLDPRPARLTEVRFYGFGWGFDAMMDDCQIVTGK